MGFFKTMRELKKELDFYKEGYEDYQRRNRYMHKRVGMYFEALKLMGIDYFVLSNGKVKAYDGQFLQFEKGVLQKISKEQLATLIAEIYISKAKDKENENETEI